MSHTNFKTEELFKILIHAGSWKRFKEMLGIDERALRTLVADHSLSLDQLTHYTDDFLRDELRRIGSTKLFSIITGAKESEIRKRCEKAGIDIKTLTLPIGATSGTGRKGENFFKEVRGISILEDCFETRGHTHEFDFRDSVYGLVNVKTANRARYTAKTRAADPNYWDFSTKGYKDCDYFAFIPLDPRGEPWMVIMAEAKHIGENYPGHLVLTGNDLRAASPALSVIGTGRVYLLLPAMLKSIREKGPLGEQFERMVAEQ